MIEATCKEDTCEHVYGWDERYNCPVMQPESKYDLLAEPLKEGVEEIKRHMVFFKYCPNCGKELKHG